MICPCGEPLHYSDKRTERQINRLIRLMGELVMIVTPWGAWKVPRHYLALHGVKASELGALAEKYGFEKVGR